MAQTNFTPILTYKSDTATSIPSAGNLTNSTNGAELAVNTADKRLFTKDSGGNVVEVGTNPSSLTMPNGTANGVVYANGSKVLTSGSALTFDGTNFATTGTITSGGSYNFNTTSGRDILWGTGSYTYITGNPSTSVMAFGIANTEGMRLTSTGLGIGTSSVTSGSKLTIAGGNLNLTQSDSRFIGGDTAGRVFLTNSDVTTYIALYGSSHASVPNIMSFVANSAERMRLDSSGNLGLGVTPSAWSGVGPGILELRGNAYVASTTQVLSLVTNAYYNGTNWIYKTTNPANRYDTFAGQHLWFTAPSGTAGNAISFTQAMTLDASGNLLVGTTTTSGKKLVTNQTGSTGYFHSGELSGTEIAYWYYDTTTVQFSSKSAGRALTFLTADVERARITSSGALLVGTTSANGGNGVTISPGAGGYIYHNSSDANNTIFYVAYSSTTVGSIARTTTATQFNTSSDYRLKNTIAPMTGALAKVALLKPCTYKWNVDGSDGEGFIAHELAEVVPQCVTGAKDAVDAEGNPLHQGIDTSFLVATLTAAIQELKAEFDAYKASHP
jgi:hypothetical protein